MPATPGPLSPSLWGTELLTSAPNEGERVFWFPESGGGGWQKEDETEERPGQLGFSERNLKRAAPLFFPRCLSLFLVLAGSRERERRKRSRQRRRRLQRQLAYLFGGWVRELFRKGGRRSRLKGVVKKLEFFSSVDNPRPYSFSDFVFLSSLLIEKRRATALSLSLFFSP